MSILDFITVCINGSNSEQIYRIFDYEASNSKIIISNYQLIVKYSSSDSPTHRHHGIFKAMYHKVLDLAKAEGISQVRLYVDKTNTPAQAVYEKLGMAECHYSMYEVEL